MSSRCIHTKASHMRTPGITDGQGRRRYGVWAGDPKGHPEAPERCIAEIPHPPSWQYAQCSRKRGHGLHGDYCKQHAKKAGEQ